MTTTNLHEVYLLISKLQLPMKYFIYLLCFIIPSKLFACDCVSHSFSHIYQTADFIATAKILRVAQVPNTSRYREIEIEISHLYKGNTTTILQTVNDSLSNCGIHTPVNSNWLIFAYYDENKVLNFGLCSGSIWLDNPYYAGIGKVNRQAQIKRTLEILEYLEQKQLNNTYTGAFYSPKFTSDFLKSLKGFPNKGRCFSIYELAADSSLNITSSKETLQFKNRKLARAIRDGIKNIKTARTVGKQQRPGKPVKILVILIYYPEDEKYQSFVSQSVL